MTAMRFIDLNADLGEGGSHDAALLELVTSANIACGGHAGDEELLFAHDGPGAGGQGGKKQGG